MIWKNKAWSFYRFIINRNHALYSVWSCITLLAAVDCWLCVFLCLCLSVFSHSNAKSQPQWNVWLALQRDGGCHIYKENHYVTLVWPLGIVFVAIHLLFSRLIHRWLYRFVLWDISLTCFHRRIVESNGRERELGVFVASGNSTPRFIPIPKCSGFLNLKLFI